MSLEITHQSFGQFSEGGDCLVIELFGDGISFSEIQSEENRPLYICHYVIDDTVSHTLGEHLTNAIKHFQFYKKTYRYVHVNYSTLQFTVCPTLFSNIEHNRLLLEFNTGSSGDKIILNDDVNTNITIIYAIEEELKSILDHYFPNHQLRHTLTVLTKLMLFMDELLKENMIVSIHSSHIEVILKQGHSVLLINQYSVKTQEDILYYLLFILEQYQLSPLTVNITLVGNTESSGNLISSLKKYIKNIRLGIGHKSIDWTSIKGMPQHFNYTLINRLFCE